MRSEQNQNEIILTEKAKKLIDEFGFIPLGGLIFKDGTKSWEIGKNSKISDIYDRSEFTKVKGTSKG